MSEEIIYLIFGLIRILLALAVLMFIGVCIIEHGIHKKYSEPPMCDNCGSEGKESLTGRSIINGIRGRSRFVCKNPNCKTNNI